MKLLIIFIIVLSSCQHAETNKTHNNQVAAQTKKLHEDECMNIIVNDGQSYIYDLVGGDYQISLGGKMKTIKFKLSKNEMDSIFTMYRNLKINEINYIDNDTKNTFIEDKCMDMPKIFTILKVFNCETMQEIQIDEECSEYNSDTEKNSAKRVKELLELIRSILNSKPEIKNAPKSDVIYM